LDSNGSTALGRHQFLIYRLFSLAGLIPVGAYLVVHLLTNATVLNGPAAFQAQVDRIHSLGIILPLVEWVFIFIPIIFHATVGLIIIGSGWPNSNTYAYGSNIRYTLQRATGIIVMFFIIWHVWQLHHMAAFAGGGHFVPEAATTSTAEVLAPTMVRILYGIGITCAVFHLANGLWTQGITWGIWTTPCAMRRAGWCCLGFGLLLGCVGLSALYGMSTVDMDRARVAEESMQDLHRYEEGDVPISKLEHRAQEK